MTPSFQIGQAIGTNVGKAFQNISDRTALDEILENASKSNDPNAITDTMSQILQRVSPEKQGKALEVLKYKYEGLQAQKKQQIQAQEAKNQLGALEKQRGLEPGALSGFGSNVKLAEQSTKPQKAGGLTTQPISPEKADKIASVVRANKDADADELAIAFAEANIEPQLSSPYIENRRRQEDTKSRVNVDRENRKAKFGEDIAKPFLMKSDEASASIPQKETALNLMEQSVLNNDLSFFSPDNVADITGIEALRTPEGALFKTAGKEYFLGNISRAGARPNQWIEQQIQQMLPQIGRSAAANLSVSRALRNELDLEKAREKITQEVASEIEESGGNWRTAASKVNERLAKYASEQQNVMFNDLRAIKAVDEGKPQKFIKVKDGTPVSKVVVEALRQMFPDDREKARVEAKKLGYAI